MKPGTRSAGFALLLTLAFQGCITIDEVDQPTTAQAGQTITITVHVQLPQTKDNPADRIFFGLLAPRDWDLGRNATITYSSTRGDGKMHLVPAGVVATGIKREWPDCLLSRFGTGVNLVKDMEWVTFQTDATYSSAIGGPKVSGTIKITTTVGIQNEIVRLGYFVTPEDGIDPHNDPFYSNELHIVGGAGQLFDFSHPQAATIVPVRSVDNDYITLTFDGNVRPAVLSASTAVFLQAVAYTRDGHPISITEKNIATRLSPMGDNKWRIQIWPRSFFHLRDGQSLTRMEYYFADRTGGKAGYDQKGAPFKYEFSAR